jgi:hypothetical protein
VVGPQSSSSWPSRPGAGYMVGRGRDPYNQVSKFVAGSVPGRAAGPCLSVTARVMVCRQVTVTAGGPGSLEWTSDVAGPGAVAGPGTVSRRPDWPSRSGVPGRAAGSCLSVTARVMVRRQVTVTAGGPGSVGAACQCGRRARDSQPSPRLAESARDRAQSQSRSDSLSHRGMEHGDVTVGGRFGRRAWDS